MNKFEPKGYLETPDGGYLNFRVVITPKQAKVNWRLWRWEWEEALGDE